jgi:hypothetical protein
MDDRVIEIAGYLGEDGRLAMLLGLGQEIKGEGQEGSLLSVRRAQMQLATYFLQRDQQARADLIVADLAQ